MAEFLVGAITGVVFASFVFAVLRPTRRLLEEGKRYGYPLGYTDGLKGEKPRPPRSL